MIYSGKNAVVLGLGHSGEAAALLLREEGAQVTICESRDDAALRAKAARLEALGITTRFGDEAENDPANYDVCVLSPGIDPVVSLVQNVVRKNIPIIGELELAFKECSCPVVAITGSNGKTTTTELTTAMLAGSGVRTAASGNIGIPFATMVHQSNELDVIVLEVSSFQLESTSTFRPHVAVWLNLSPNHLDRYRDMKEYRDAKLRIFRRQTEEDFAVVNAQEDLPPMAARRITFSAATDEADFTLRGTVIHFRGEPVLDQSKIQLQGLHNAENLMAALGVGVALGADLERMAAAVADYHAPAHRCEFVRERAGVRWVNDSKATNLDALEKAIRSQDRPLVLVAGGKDKGLGFESMAQIVQQRVREVVLIGEMKDQILKAWSCAGLTIHLVDTLEEAVTIAADVARTGETVLFSPGTSSFDMFRNYGERGTLFKEFVNALPVPGLEAPDSSPQNATKNQKI